MRYTVDFAVGKNGRFTGVWSHMLKTDVDVSINVNIAVGQTIESYV